MSLLSKKSWHVRNRKNIERVHNDEAKAEELLKIEQDRILKAEQEFRIQQLKLRTGHVEKDTEKHFSLFDGIDDPLSKSETANQNRGSKLESWRRHLVRPDANKPWYCSGNSASLIESSPTKLTIRINDPLDKINLKNSLSTRSLRTRNKTAHPDSRTQPGTSQASIEFRPAAMTFKNSQESDSSPEIIGIIKPKTRESHRKDPTRKHDKERDKKETKKSSSKHKKHRHKHRHKHMDPRKSRTERINYN